MRRSRVRVTSLAPRKTVAAQRFFVLPPNIKTRSNSQMATIWLPERDFLFLGLLHEQVFQCIYGLAVCFLQGMSVNVHSGRCLRVAQSTGYSSEILLACNQQCGGCVTETMEGDCRELLIWSLAYVVSFDGVLERGVWSRVGHLFAVILNEHPLCALPEIAYTQTILEPFFAEDFESLCEEVGDGDSSVRILRFRLFGDLLLAHDTDGFGDAYSVVLKINVRPLQSEQLPFTKTAVDRQNKQYPDLFRDFFCPFFGCTAVE